VSAGLTFDIVIKLLPGEAGYKLSFQRSFDDRPYDILLPNLQGRAENLRKRLSVLLNPLRRHIGLVQLKLDEAQTKRAAGYLDRLGYGMLALLLEGSGRRASDIMPELAEFLLPVFLSRPGPSPPIVEIEAAALDALAWRIPFEFLPIAPLPNPQLNEREGLERFLGFRALIGRSLRGGPSELHPDASGRVPVHLFAHAGEELPGIKKQRLYLGNNAAIVTAWPSKTSVPDVFEGVSQLAERLLSLPPPVRDNAIRGIAHFSCHYMAGGPDANGGYVAEPAFGFGQCTDGSDLVISIFELRGELEARQALGSRAQFAALFFLNACETAASSHDDTLLGFLQSRSATAIIGSETLLPDQLAGEFAIEFYREFLRSAPIGKAVLNARRRLLELFSNPVGLFYTFYGNPALQVSRVN
jgi:hypothetical protein